MFASHTSNVYCHGTHRILPMKTSAASSDLGVAFPPKDSVIIANESRNHTVLPSNCSKRCATNRIDSNGTSGEEVSGDLLEERHCVPTAVPNFLITCLPKVCVHLSGGREVSEGGRGGWVKMLSSFLCAQVQTAPLPLYCCDRAAAFIYQEWLSGGPAELKLLLQHGLNDDHPPSVGCPLLPSLLYHAPRGLDAAYPPNGWSHIYIPGNW